MATSSDKTNKALKIISTFEHIEAIAKKISEKSDINEQLDRLPIEFGVSKESTLARKKFLMEETDSKLEYLTNEKAFTAIESFQGNIENYIGQTTVPTGIIGPVRVLGSAAQGDFYVPLATSEGALVASYHRGVKACYLSGGATSICLIEGVQRSPVFKFKHLGELGLFLVWVMDNMSTYQKITSENSRFAELMDVRTNVEGNHLILIFEYQTGDASGQNMVTICTDAICKYIVQNCPVKPEFWFIEGNYSGDKKATAGSFSNVRGKKITTEIVISEKVVNEVLKTTPDAMAEYWRSSTIGVIQSGAIGAQGHYANGLTALFMATGQDVACVSEAATGITRMEKTAEGSLYASITLPNLIVGTIGGGTSLPTQKECLDLMGCYGAGKSRKFAEIIGAVLLAGELSIAAALSAGHFSSAHKKFGRKS